MAKRMDFLKNLIHDLKDQNLFIELPVLGTEQKNRVVLNGRKVIMMCSNNYLGFANHPRLREAAKAAIDRWGFGAGAVRQIAGTMEIHIRLEEMLAEYKRTKAALVFVAGIAANRGTIQALMGEEDAIISDELNHGSIIDGIRLTKSKRFIYPHLDMEGLKKALQKAKDARRKLITTDGVFSMDGDIAPLDRIVELAEEHDAMVMVDDAHGDGVLGKDGRGVIDHFDMEGRVDIDMGTLSKAFGCLGGYIAGSNELREYLINAARSFIFTTAHPPCVAAATMEALRMVQDEPQHLRKLWDNTGYFKKGMSGMGFDIGGSQTPITPVMAGESRTAMELSGQLLQEGLFAKPIVFPLVAKDKARVRIIVTAQHTKEDLNEALEIFERVGKRMKLI